MENMIGTTVKGYELTELIGVGGFGAVFKAFQATVGREVAIKVILPEYANQPDFIRRFETEAQLVARLEHIHIVPLYDYWRDPDGAYLVMRYMRGGSLMDALQRGPYDLESAALLLDQMASALTVAHRNNVIHRDIKPPNILLDEDGNAYLMDFGIAKVLAKGEGALDDASTMIGSPDYLAPEQARMHPVTPQTDIYNLGVLLYEMLTAEHPFPDLSPVERLTKHLTEPIPEVKTLDPEVSEAVNDVIQKATAKDPGERYESVHEMALAFREAAAITVIRPVAGMEMLTPREHRILNYLAEGKSNREIAADIPAKLASVRWHINQIYRKLNVRSRKQAVVRARELDLVGEMVPAIPLPTGVIAIPEPENPYKGLRAFQIADERDFFGREIQVERLLERLGDKGEMARFLAVVGPSGSGKSSLVKAGLIPALWRGELPGSQRWYVIDMMPGAHPLDELEVSLFQIAAQQPENLREQLERDERGLVRASQMILPDDESDLLLVIDQFEEVFTLIEDEEVRTHFLDLLSTAATDPRSRVRVLITLRADFYDRPLHYPRFGELVRSRTETVLPLSAEELERAVLGPAERAGVTFDEGLVASIVADVQNQPGSLPLLQYALTELFEAREDHKLTLEGYQNIGGAVGALASRAEGIYTEMDQDSREAAHHMFMRLVTLGEGVEDTRRRVPRGELLAIADDPDVMDEVIDTYTAYRLFSLDNDPVTRSPTVELAHEAVLREWERLREWVNQARDDIRMGHRLGLAAKEWRDAEQDQSFLLRGTRLEQFETWEAESDLALTPDERAYLDASLADRDARRAAEAERQAREQALEKRSRRFLRALAGVMAIAAVVGVGLAGFALNQRGDALDSAATATMAQGQALFEAATSVAAEDEAQRQQSIAEQEARAALEAYSLSLAANARQFLQSKDPITALALAMAATEIEEPPSLALEILTEVAYSPGPQRRFDITDIVIGTRAEYMVSIAISPDGRNAIIGSVNGDVILFDMETGSETLRLDGHTGFVRDLAFSPDGKRVISAGSIHAILWDLTTGQEIRRFQGHSGELTSLDVSPDGLLIATAGPNSSWRRQEPGELILWDAETGQEIRRCTGGHRNAVNDVVFSPDGRTMLASSGFEVDWWHTTYLWTPTVWRRLPGVDEFDLILWDVDSCEIVHRFKTEDHDNFQLAIGPKGDWALTSSTDHNLYLWNLRSGERITALGGHSNPVIALAVGKDGRIAMSGDAYSYQLILWDLEIWEPQKYFQTHSYGIGSVPDIGVAISPDGRRAISASTGGTLILWDLVDPREINRFAGHTDNVTDIAFSQDGRYLLTSSGRENISMGLTDDNTIRLWDIETGEQIGIFEGHEDGITSIDISPDGRQLLSGSGDRSIRLWDVETGQEIRSFVGHGSWVTDVAFMPDGSSGLSGSDDGSIIMWDLERGTWQPFTHYGFDITLAISPDGQKFFSCGSLRGEDQNSVVIWDLEAGYDIGRFWGHDETGVHISPLAVSPNGSYVISGDSSGNLIKWNTTSLDEIHRLKGHNAPISGISISTDGSRAFSCDESGTSRLWDLATGESIGYFSPPAIGEIVRCAISPDGQLAAISVDETIILYKLDVLSYTELLDWIAENRYVRELTCEERELYRIEPLCD